MADAPLDTDAPRVSLAEIARVFFRLGATSFGGPAAHVAIMEAELVRRRRWLSHERFLDLFGAANLIPGPSSTELAIFIGYERAGWRGLVVAGASFIVPAAAMVGAIAWAYVRFGALPQLAAVLYGIKPIVVAVVAQAAWALAPKAVKRSWLLGAVGAGACVAAALGVDALAVLVGSGVVVAAARGTRSSQSAMLMPAMLGAGAATAPGVVAIFLAFLKIGAFVFGSGYVLLAFLRADLVERLRWLTEAQLLDAVAVGQITPGPVFTTATFIGYVVGGVGGAVVATIAIFLPGFALVAAARPFLTRVRRSPFASAFLDGVNVASLALMAVVAFQLARAALVDVPTVGIAVAGAILLVRWKVNSTWLVVGAAVAGALVQALR